MADTAGIGELRRSVEVSGGQFYLVKLGSTGEKELENTVLTMESCCHGGGGAASVLSSLSSWSILHLSSSLQQEPGDTEVTSSCRHAECRGSVPAVRGRHFTPLYTRKIEEISYWKTV